MSKNVRLNKFELFLHSEKGQRFFNFAYSVGAAIVIWGALFKILHLPGGSALLCIGMGTEIAMFIISAFDRPSKEYAWEQVFPELQRKHNEEGTPEEDNDEINESGTISGGSRFGNVIIGGGFSGGNATQGNGDVIISGGAGGALPAGLDLEEDDAHSLHESISKMAAAADQLSQMAELTSATQDTPGYHLGMLGHNYVNEDGVRRNSEKFPFDTGLRILDIKTEGGKAVADEV